VGAVGELQDLRVIKIGHRWIDRIPVYGSWLLIALVALCFLLPLPNKAAWDTGSITVILIVYSVYVLALEFYSRIFPAAYDRLLIRILRVFVNLIVISALVYFSSGARSYFWCLYALPIFQANIYLRTSAAVSVIAITLSSYWLVSLIPSAPSGTSAEDYAFLFTNSLILLLLAVALYWLFGAARESRKLEYEVMESLRLIALDIAAQLDQESLLKTIIQRAVEMLNAKGGGIYECNHEQGELTVVADWGGKQSIVGHKLKKGDGMAGRVMESGNAMVVDDYSTWPLRCPALEPDLFRAVVEVPLAQSEHIIGVLYVTDDEKGRTFTERDTHLLSLIASHAAITISNVKAFDESRKNIAQLELLSQISAEIDNAITLDHILEATLREALKAVNTSDGSIMIFDPRTNELEIKAWLVDGELKNSNLHKRFSLEQGIAGYVAATRKPYNCKDTLLDKRYLASHTRRSLRSILSVPIISNDNLLCIINADSKEPNWFKDSAIELFSILGGQVATAIESLKLQEVSLSLSSLPLEDLYVKIVESAYTLIGADVVTLFLKDSDTDKIVRAAVYPPAEETNVDDIREDGLTKEIIKTNKHISINDAQHDERVKPEMKLRGVKAVIGVPLTVRLNSGSGEEFQTLGVLFLSTQKERPFGKREMQILYSLANPAAIAIMQARLYKKVLLKRDFQQSLLESAFDAIIAIDKESIIQEFNASAERVLGYKKDEVIGKNVAFLYEDQEDAREIMRLLLDEKNKGRLINYYTYTRTKTEGVIPIRLSASLMENGSVGFFRDQREIEMMRQHIEHLRGLHVTGQAIVELDDLEKIFETTVAGAIETLQADVVYMYYYDQKPGDIRMHTIKHGSDQEVELPAPLKEALAGGSVHFSEDAQADALVGDFARRVGLRAVAAGSLRVRDKTLGVMICGYRNRHPFDDEEQIMIRLFMSEAAIAIEAAIATEQAKELHQYTELLNKLYDLSLAFTTELKMETELQNLLNSALTFTGAQYGALGIIHPHPSRKVDPFIHSGVKPDVAKRLPPPRGHGLLGKLLQEDEVINVQDIQQRHGFTGFEHDEHPEITSFLGRPIVFKGRPIGNIYLGNKKGADRFSANDVKILGLLANHASRIITNFRVQQQTSIKEAITIASTLLSQLAHAAGEESRMISAELDSLSNTLPSGAHREILDRVSTQIRKLDSPILELLAGVQKRMSELFDLDQIFYDIAGKPEIRPRVPLSIDIPPACSIRGNKQLISIACRILIENALKATEKAGSADSIVVKCKIEKGQVLGVITHRGRSIPEKVQPDLFKSAVTDDRGEQRHASFIVGMIMRLHEGDVSIQETGPQGTTIDFWLPLARH
jgi:PAS domain S-box-containing protein